MTENKSEEECTPPIENGKEISNSSQKTNVFDIKGYLPIVVSVTALLVSFANFYYTNLKIEDNLQLRILSASFTNSDIKDTSNMDNFISDTAIVHVACTNIGNRQAVLLSPSYMVSNTETLSIDSPRLVLGKSNIFPAILQPHETKLIDIKISLLELQNFCQNAKMDTSFGLNEYRYFFKLVFYALDSEAKKHEAYSNVIVEVAAKNNYIVSMSERSEIELKSSQDSYIPIALFKN